MFSHTGIARAFKNLKASPISCHIEDKPVDKTAALSTEVAKVQAALAKSITPCVLFEAQDNERYLVQINGVNCMVTHASRAHALALANYAVPTPTSHNERNFWFVGPQAARAALQQAVQS